MIKEKTLGILDIALKMVRNVGFESVSINSLASEVGMSKSGLFAHFNSKEKMHTMILDHAAARFSEEVFRKSMKAEKGLPRLQTIVNNWMKWYQKDDGGTCPFLAASIEYDYKGGPVKETLKNYTNQLISSLQVSVDHCIELGHFEAQTDPAQATFELYSMIIGHLIYLRTMQRKSARKIFTSAFESFIQKYQSQ